MANFVKLNGYDVEDTIAREKINNMGNFSTNEVNTGQTWIDNKPIYRKVFVKTDFEDVTHSYAHDIENLDQFIKIEGMFYTPTVSVGNNVYQFPFDSTDGEGLYLTANNSTFSIVNKGEHDYTGITCIITLYYTKTN